jgi:hypothetical protein
MKRGNVILRDLVHSEQSEVAQGGLIDALKKNASVGGD